MQDYYNIPRRICFLLDKCADSADVQLKIGDCCCLLDGGEGDCVAGVVGEFDDEGVEGCWGVPGAGGED